MDKLRGGDVFGSAWQYVLGREERRSTLGYDYLVKLALLGNSGVGKSSLLFRFVHSSFCAQLPPTLNVDYSSKVVAFDGRQTKLQIWDTAGHERYRSVSQSFYRSAMGIMLVYDVGNRKSFEDLNEWLSSVKAFSSAHVQILLVGSKRDLQERAVSCEEATFFAEERGIPYLEASALSGCGVSEAFERLGKAVVTYIAEVEGEMATSATAGRRSGVNAALQDGALDTVQGLCLMASPSGTRRRLARRPPDFRRYAIDDYLDNACDT